MMINVTRGNSFSDLVDYIAQDDDPQRTLVSGNTVDKDESGEVATSISEVKSKFESIEAIPKRGNVRKLAFHASLSLPPDENLSNKSWGDVVDDYLNIMGLSTDNHLYVAALHKDTACEHLHVVASRLGLDGKVWVGEWDGPRSKQAAAILEEKYGLYRAHQKTTGAVIPNKWEKEYHAKTGKPLARVQIASAVDVVIPKTDGSLEHLKTSLDKLGVNLWMRRDNEQQPTGLSFALKEGLTHRYAGKKIGVAYSLTRIKKRLNAVRAKEKGSVNYPEASDNLTNSESVKTERLSDWYQEKRPALFEKRIATSNGQFSAPLQQSTLIDKNRRLELHGDVTQADVRELVMIAKARGWREVSVTGSADFRKQATEALAEANLTQVNSKSSVKKALKNRESTQKIKNERDDLEID